MASHTGYLFEDPVLDEVKGREPTRKGATQEPPLCFLWLGRPRGTGGAGRVLSVRLLNGTQALRAPVCAERGGGSE